MAKNRERGQKIEASVETMVFERESKLQDIRAMKEQARLSKEELGKIVQRIGRLENMLKRMGEGAKGQELRTLKRKFDKQVEECKREIESFIAEARAAEAGSKAASPVIPAEAGIHGTESATAEMAKEAESTKVAHRIIFDEKYKGKPEDQPESEKEIHEQYTLGDVHGRCDFGGEGCKYNRKGDEKENQDSMFSAEGEGGSLVVGVVDGAGGSRKGLEAGLAANESLLQNLSAGLSFTAVFNKADNDVGARVATEGYACAVVARIEKSGKVTLGNSGDTKAIAIRNGKIIVATEMQNVAAVLVKIGTVSPEEYFTLPTKSTILGYIGAQESKKSEKESSQEFDFPGQNGDQIILASDGLWDLVSEYEVSELAQRYKGRELQEKLFTLAFARNNSTDKQKIRYSADKDVEVDAQFGNGDNITVQVVELKNLPEKSPELSPEEPKEAPKFVLEPGFLEEKARCVEECKKTMADLKQLKDSAGQLLPEEIESYKQLIKLSAFIEGLGEKRSATAEELKKLMDDFKSAAYHFYRELTERTQPRKKIIDIKESALLELIQPEKLNEVAEQIILGNRDIAEQLFKNIFVRRDVDIVALEHELKKHGYSYAEFSRLWLEKLYKEPFGIVAARIEQSRRNLVAKNISRWEKFTIAAPFYVRKVLVNALPVLAVGGVVSATVMSGVVGAVAATAAGAAAGGAAGLWGGLRRKVEGVKGWFAKGEEKSQLRKDERMARLEHEKRESLDFVQQMLEDLAANQKQYFQEVSSALSQGLRNGSARELASQYGRTEAEIKANMELALAQVKTKIEEEYKAKGAMPAEQALEQKTSQERRAEALLMKLYDTQEIENLIADALRKDPAFLRILKGIDAFKNLDFDRIYESVSGKNIDPQKKESALKKAACVIASTIAGAGAGAAFASNPALRPLVGALAGGYFGAMYGHKKDLEKKRADFEKTMKENVDKAEEVIREYERMNVEEWLAKFPLLGIDMLQKKAKDLRVPLTLDLIKDPILKLRAQNALRRIEAIYIDLSLNAPVKERRRPDEIPKNSAVENLLAAFSKEEKNFTLEQKKVKEELTKKPGKLRMLGWALGGVIAGAAVGYGATELSKYIKEHVRGHIDTAGARRGAGVATVAAVEDRGRGVGAAAIPEVATPPHNLPKFMDGVETKVVGDIDTQAVVVTGKGPSQAAHRLEDFFQRNRVQWGHKEIVAEMQRHGYVFHADGSVDHPVMFHKGGGKLVPWVDAQNKGHFEIMGMKKGGVDVLQKYWHESGKPAISQAELDRTMAESMARPVVVEQLLPPSDRGPLFTEDLHKLEYIYKDHPEELARRMEKITPYYEQLADLAERGLANTPEGRGLKEAIIRLSQDPRGVSLEQYINWPKGVAYHQTGGGGGGAAVAEALGGGGRDYVLNPFGDTDKVVGGGAAAQAGPAAGEVAIGGAKAAKSLEPDWGLDKVAHKTKVWNYEDLEKFKGGGTASVEALRTTQPPVAEQVSEAVAIGPETVAENVRNLRGLWDKAFIDYDKDIDYYKNDEAGTVEGLLRKIENYTSHAPPEFQARASAILNNHNLDPRQRILEAATLANNSGLQYTTEEKLALGGEFTADPKEFTTLVADRDGAKTRIVLATGEGSHAMFVRNDSGGADFISNENSRFNKASVINWFNQESK